MLRIWRRFQLWLGFRRSLSLSPSVSRRNGTHQLRHTSRQLCSRFGRLAPHDGEERILTVFESVQR